MDLVKQQSDMEEERFKLSDDFKKIKPQPKTDRFYVKFLDLLEYHQEDMATIFRAVIHNG